MKYKVINDLDDFPVKAGDGGLYAILPYEKLNRNKKALFKVGLADNYDRRFESHHTYYPLGFYYKNLLLNPKKNIADIRKQTDEQFKKKNQGQRPTPAQRAALKKLTNIKNYLSAEKAVFAEIKELGGQQLRTTTRVRDANETGGVSEWFYTNEKTLDKAFEKAHKDFGGKLLSTHLNDINSKSASNKSSATYTGEIHYKIV